jgi:hypothetical protein
MTQCGIQKSIHPGQTEKVGNLNRVKLAVEHLNPLTGLRNLFHQDA